MRQDCKYFESRTYPNGDTVRKCDLDLAPEAPWRCPDNCPKFTRRLADVTWSPETVNEFLTRPSQFIPGNRMVFIGVGKPKDRANLIAYLRSHSDSPAPLP